MDFTLIQQVNALLLEKEKSVTVPAVAKTTAKAVYHRDYMKTRKKKYRTVQTKDEK